MGVLFFYAANSPTNCRLSGNCIVGEGHCPSHSGAAAELPPRGKVLLPDKRELADKATKHPIALDFFGK